MMRPEKPARTARRRPGEILAVGAVVLYAVLLLGIPLAAVLFGAFSEGFERFRTELLRPEAVSALRLTIQLAFVSAAINGCFGLIVAVTLARHRFSGRSLLNGLVDLPFGVSPVVAGLALLLLFGRGGWLENVVSAVGLRVVFDWTGLLLATVFVSLPFVIREVIPVLQQVGTAHEEAAYVLGAKPWQAFWWITLPAIRWAFVYGLILTLARSLGEFGAVLVVGGGIRGITQTATVYIYHSLDARNEVGAFSMALVLAVVTIAVFLGAEAIKRREERRRAGEGPTRQALR
ncbi:MAG TPA: sulfate ABC transporter permease subunit [Acidobacteriota bacterium]|nr:sulfate ABC transporter permease subunit [Acidobacteriota bacterium]